MFDTYEDIFRERADAYHAAMAALPDARAAEFRSVIDPLGDLTDRLVCDMPAGGGYLRRYLPDGARYLAVEPSTDFFDACPVDARADRMKASIHDVPFADGAVDHIVSLAGLHHAPDLGAIFREMWRLVRDDGRVVLADVAMGTPQDTFLNSYVADNNPMGHDGRFLDEHTVPLIEASGLRMIDDRMVAMPWLFADRLQAAAYCIQLFGIVGRPPAAVAEAIDDTVGFDRDGDGCAMRWALRRIICVAA